MSEQSTLQSVYKHQLKYGCNGLNCSNYFCNQANFLSPSIVHQKDRENEIDRIASYLANTHGENNGCYLCKYLSPVATKPYIVQNINDFNSHLSFKEFPDKNDFNILKTIFNDINSFQFLLLANNNLYLSFYDLSLNDKKCDEFRMMIDEKSDYFEEYIPLFVKLIEKFKNTKIKRTLHFLRGLIIATIFSQFICNTIHMDTISTLISLILKTDLILFCRQMAKMPRLLQNFVSVCHNAITILLIQDDDHIENINRINQINYDYSRNVNGSNGPNANYLNNYYDNDAVFFYENALANDNIGRGNIRSDLLHNICLVLQNLSNMSSKNDIFIHEHLTSYLDVDQEIKLLQEKRLFSFLYTPAVLTFDFRRRCYFQLNPIDHSQIKVLNIRRGRIMTDAAKLLNLTKKDLEGEIRFKFEDEEAMDFGGVRREFFGIIGKTYNDLRNGILRKISNEHLWFYPDFDTPNSQMSSQDCNAYSNHQNYGTDQNQQNYNAYQSQQNYNVDPNQQNYSAYQNQQNYNVDPNSQNFNAYSNQQNFNADPNQQNYNAYYNQQNYNVDPNQQNYNSYSNQQNYNSYSNQQNYNVDPNQQNYNVDPNQQNYNVDPNQQNYNVDPNQQNYNVDPNQQNYNAYSNQQNYNTESNSCSYDSISSQSSSNDVTSHQIYNPPLINNGEYSDEFISVQRSLSYEQDYDESDMVALSEVDDSWFRLLGMLVGLCVRYQSQVLLNIKFPILLYKALIQKEITRVDLMEIYPDLINNLEKLSHYTNDEFDQLDMRFSATTINHSIFDPTYPDNNLSSSNSSPHTTTSFDSLCSAQSGQIVNEDLVKNGCEVQVTEENVHEYVNCYFTFLLRRLLNKKYSQFYQGFVRVVGNDLCTWFSPEELSVIVSGEEKLDWNDLVNNVIYCGGYNSESVTVFYFWDIFFNVFNQSERKKLLFFITGLRGSPIGGLKTVHLRIERTEDVNFLPTAHTCIMSLVLPDYQDKNVLENSLRICLRNSEGFGFA